MLEGLIVGTPGAALGCILSGLLAAFISKVGIPMPPLTAWRSSILPALKAARMETAEASRHNP
jgi:ABC-type lipoprotein release transport system permease subunit